MKSQSNPAAEFAEVISETQQEITVQNSRSDVFHIVQLHLPGYTPVGIQHIENGQPELACPILQE